MRKMKDSGVPWIGEIPEGWGIEPLKQIYKFDKGLPITKADLKEEGLPVLSYGQIHSKDNIPLHIMPNLVRYVSNDYADNYSSKANKGDLLFADTSEDIEGIGNHSYVDLENGIFAGYHTILARNQRNNDGRYFSLLLETDAWRSQLRKMASGIKVYSVTKRMLNGTSVIVPPDDEQSLIADYLDNKCSNGGNKRFAIIVDEAHSSQTGEAAKKLKRALADTEKILEEYAATEEEDEATRKDDEDNILDEIAAHGQHDNLSFFAFTATPKGSTLDKDVRQQNMAFLALCRVKG